MENKIQRWSAPFPFPSYLSHPTFSQPAAPSPAYISHTIPPSIMPPNTPHEFLSVFSLSLSLKIPFLFLLTNFPSSPLPCSLFSPYLSYFRPLHLSQPFQFPHLTTNVLHLLTIDKPNSISITLARSYSLFLAFFYLRMCFCYLVDMRYFCPESHWAPNTKLSRLGHQFPTKFGKLNPYLYNSYPAAYPRPSASLVIPHHPNLYCPTGLRGRVQPILPGKKCLQPLCPILP